MAAARHGHNDSSLKVPGNAGFEMKSYYEQPITNNGNFAKMQNW